MGVLTDIIIADPQDAPAIYAAGGRHATKWETLESKSLLPTDLAALSRILTGVPADARGLDDFMNESLEADDPFEESCLFVIPDALRSALASVGPGTACDVATKWAELDGSQPDRREVGHLASFLTRLAAHANKARSQGKSLLLWISG